MKNRICKKCLLAEMDNEKLLEDVRKAVDRLADDIKVSEEEYNRRLDVCKQCDYLHEGTCDKCGCYVELRAATSVSHCPYKRW